MVRRRSTVRFCQGARWRRSSVGESARLIIERSTVRICPSLQARKATRPAEENGRSSKNPEVRNRHGIRQASTGHPGVPGVQASQLHHHQVEGEHARACRAEEVLPVVPHACRPQGDPLILPRGRAIGRTRPPTRFSLLDQVRSAGILPPDPPPDSDNELEVGDTGQWLKWLEHRSPKPAVEGSSPSCPARPVGGIADRQGDRVVVNLPIGGARRSDPVSLIHPPIFQSEACPCR